MKTLLLIFVLANMPLAMADQPKFDLKGFYPTMSRDAFEAARKPLECAGMVCRVKEGTLSFEFSTKQQPEVLKTISLHYESGSSPEETVKTISEQYGSRPSPSDLKARIAYARSHTEYVPFLSKMMTLGGGYIANWKTSSGLNMSLWFEPLGGVNKFVLSISGQKLVAAEKAAEQTEKARKRAADKKLNSNIRF